MQPGDFLCDCKPKAIALCGMGYICLIELVKNMGKGRCRNRLLFVREGDSQGFLAFPDDNVDFFPPSGENLMALSIRLIQTCI